MFIACRIGILVLLTSFLPVLAADKIFADKHSQELLIVPMTYFNTTTAGKAFLGELKKTTTSGKLSEQELSKLGIKKTNESGFAAAMAYSDDAPELTCYRCCFKKIEKDRCGAYKSVFGKIEWAAKCPEPK